MKIRTAMKSIMGICEIKSDGCLASEIPQKIEVIFVGQDEKPSCACMSCIQKKLRNGDWAMWYWADDQAPPSEAEQGLPGE
jgi:hypothetical protein